MSKLTPEQIKLQQQLVIDHVNKQAIKDKLNSIQKAQLLAETLAHNGLPQINNPVENTLATVVNTVAEGEGIVTDLFSSIFGDSTVNKVGVAAGAAPDQDHHVPGLPKPGTLEHTITLAIFKAQQSLNAMLKPNNQPAIDNKLGVAAGATDDDDGILATVAAMPAQIIRFISPPSEATTNTAKPGVTYSEVTSGPDPTYAALGLLTTGALGTVLYSYVTSDTDLASSATALAKGAVDAIKRNDIVQVATNAIAKVTGDKYTSEPDHGNLDYNYYDQNSVGYSDYGYGYHPPTNTEHGFSDLPHSIPSGIEFYEPDISIPDSVPYITYTEDHSPWELINSGHSTEHLYRAFRR